MAVFTQYLIINIALFAACYTTVLAWLVSFAVYQIGGLFV